jgi:phosphohistidine swiveling domain-containing protein
LAVKLIDAGMTLSEKSASVPAVTESEACVLTLWPLTVVVNVTVPVVVGVEEAAVIVSGKATPGVTDSSIGETVTPLGNPDSETVVGAPPAGAPSSREAC